MTRGASSCEPCDPSQLQARLSRDGYAFLPRYAASNTTRKVAERLGDLLVPWEGAHVQELTPRAKSTPNTYSGIFGLNEFPFHTDLAHWAEPPRYLLLRCIRGYSDTPTLMLDGRKLASRIGENVLRRALVRPRRPLAGKVQILRLQQHSPTGEIIRWDEVFLKPASRVGELAFSQFRSLMAQSVATPVVMRNDGDVLIIDNWRMFHARPAIAPHRQERRLQRAYLRGLT